MRNIIDQKGKLKSKKILLRLSLNVPIENGVVADDFKIKKVLPTIEFLRNEGARIIILGHIRRKKTDSLLLVGEYLKQFFPFEFIEDVLSDEVPKKIAKMKDGDIFLCENLRKYDGEINNDPDFSKKISLLGDIYVNEGFSVSHRSHSSIVSLPKMMESYFGPLFIKEVEELKQILYSGHPRILILGGNKLKTKLPLIKNFLDIVDFIFVGGSLANNFFKLKGFEIGRSFFSEENFDLENLMNNPKIILPVDVIVQNPKGIFTRKPDEVLKDDEILDSGQETISLLKEIINKSKFVLWNGPLGDYKKGFTDSTFELIRIIAKSDIESVVGGGDTVFTISKLALNDSFDFLSTGGGAMLEFVANGTLVGIEAQKD